MMRTTYYSRLLRIWGRLLDIDPIVPPDLEEWKQAMGKVRDRISDKLESIETMRWQNKGIEVALYPCHFAD